MSELNFLDTGGNKQKITTPAVNSMAFNTANTERVRITSNGRLLIGTSTSNISGAFSPVVSTGGASNNGGFQAHYNTGAYGGGAMTTRDTDGGGLDFWTYTGNLGSETNWNRRLRINNYGLVTRPFQYHLHADRSGTLTGYDAGGSFGTPMIFNRVVSETKDSSLSSCFNTSNGLFTAPVTGVYIFNAAAYGGSGNIFGQSWFTLNGSRCTATDWVINSGYAFIQNFQQIRLAAGNTVGFKPYASGQNNVTIFENNNHTYFKVSLIG